MIFVKKHWHYFFYILLAALYSFFLLNPIRLTVVDLGRHIANGRELIQGNAQVLYTNHYSYVMPQERFVNHHWFFGLIAYFLEQTVGFSGLHLFNILILLTALLLLLKMMEDKSHPFIASLLGLLSVLFLAARAEIRPESIGLLFIAHTLRQLYITIDRNSLSKKQLILLLIQQLIWVNTHISFIFGFCLIGLLWLCSALFKNPKLSPKTNKDLFMAVCGSIGLSFVNPNFFRGFLEPLTIFVDYGYSIVENQTLLFLWRAIGHSSLIMFVAFLIGFVPIFIISLRKLNLFEIFLTLLGIILGYSALRNIPLFVILVMPTAARVCWTQYKNLAQRLTIESSSAFAAGLLMQLYIVVMLLSATGNLNSSATLQNRHLGLVADEAAAAQFLNNYVEPAIIFNNYDLGSYLIYHLYPEYRVFTDNRPEAYNEDFFQKKYIPMQQDAKIWEKLSKEYQINMVVFGINDITPWSRQFASYISTQSNWNQIFSDQYVSIWLKNAGGDT